MILARPWLAIEDAFIGCRSGSMVVSNVQTAMNLNPYPQKKNVDLYNPW